jgi:hypothetical protein
MPSLTGQTPAATYQALLTVNNTGGGLDDTLRLIEDGSGLQSPLQLSTSSVALNGMVWPSIGASVGMYLRVSSIANTLEWYQPTATDITTTLGYVPANSAIGQFSNSINISGLTITNQVTVVTTTAVTPVFTFVTTTGGTIKFLCQVQDTTTNAIHSEELLVVTDSSTFDLTGFAVVTTQGTLGTFNVEMSGSDVVLTFQATNQTNKNVTVTATYVTA